MAVPLSAPRTTEAPYLEQAVAQLREWPALTLSQIPGGFAFAIQDIEILRLTGHSTAQLHLTGPMIERLHHALCTSTQINPAPITDG
ncbi:luciferase family protein [Sphaerisporangium aureirubrum]|uniref:Luciferase family protein n=1 Tax=Sphaerisporangium aureirubrum TaxID=1544736 RepID=A0ABW1NMV1_9ACTN